MPKAVPRSPGSLCPSTRSHVNRTTSYLDPRSVRPEGPEETPEPRTVQLVRRPDVGFGFVAGSEKPVLVRYVTADGPSVGLLQPGDQILAINGQDVRDAPRHDVIELVRAAEVAVTLVVCQPPPSKVRTEEAPSFSKLGFGIAHVLLILILIILSLLLVLGIILKRVLKVLLALTLIILSSNNKMTNFYSGG